MANVSSRREAYAAKPDAESPWLCLWLGAANAHAASLSILLEQGQAGNAQAPWREIVVQPVKGVSEEPVGAADVAHLGEDGRYRIGTEGVQNLLSGLRVAEAVLVREPNEGPVIGRVAMDEFRRALSYAQARQTVAKAIPSITPKPFGRAQKGDPEKTVALHRQHCANGTRERQEVEMFRLTTDLQLWTLLCRQSGYNFKILAMMISPRGKPVALVLPSIVDHEGVGPDLANLHVNPELGTLEDYRKTRGAGDCGIRRRWAWTGRRFVLASEEFMPRCFGADHSQWLRMYTSTQPLATEPPRPPC